MNNIRHTLVLDKAVEQHMEQDLAAYESEHGIDVNYQRFYLIYEDDSSHVIGVLNAYTAFSEVYIDDLWVDSENRGQGIGSLLIKALEEKFTDQGFNNINLVTSAFQAPDFYKKCGFKLEYIRENKHNPKLTKFFFVKFFKNEQQHQGLKKK